jgi:DNA-binding response OmpR family regulator
MIFQGLDPKRVPSLAGLSVAVWEPGLMQRMVLRLMLEETGAEVLEARKRVDLLAMVQQNRPDLIFIGTGPMPGLPIAFCRQVRRLMGEASAIVLLKPRLSSADDVTPSPWDCALTKPFTALQLFGAISRVRSRMRARARASKRGGASGGRRITMR